MPRHLVAGRLSRALRRLGQLPVAVVTAAGSTHTLHALYRDGRDEFGSEGAMAAVRRPYLIGGIDEMRDVAVGDVVTFRDPETDADTTREIAALDPEPSSGLMKLRLRRAS